MTPALFTRQALAALLSQVLNERNIAARLVVGQTRPDIVVPPFMPNLAIANILFFRAWVDHKHAELVLYLVEDTAECAPWVFLTPKAAGQRCLVGLNQPAYFIAFLVAKQMKQECQNAEMRPWQDITVAAHEMHKPFLKTDSSRGTGSPQRWRTLIAFR